MRRSRKDGRRILSQLQSVPAEFWRHGEQPQASTVGELQRILARLDPNSQLLVGETRGARVAVVGFGSESLAVEIRELFG